MAQTAVEWFNQQLVDRQNGNGDSRSWDEIYEKAKEIENEQLNIARIDGINLANKGYGSKNISNLPNVNPNDVIPSSPQFVKETI